MLQKLLKVTNYNYMTSIELTRQILKEKSGCSIHNGKCFREGVKGKQNKGMLMAKNLTTKLLAFSFFHLLHFCKLDFKI